MTQCRPVRWLQTEMAAGSASKLQKKTKHLQQVASLHARTLAAHDVQVTCFDHCAGMVKHEDQE